MHNYYYTELLKLNIIPQILKQYHNTMWDMTYNKLPRFSWQMKQTIILNCIKVKLHSPRNGIHKDVDVKIIECF